MLDAYRVAYGKMIADPDFVDRGRKLSDDFEPWSNAEVELLIRTLGGIPKEAIDRLRGMLRKQGLQGQEAFEPHMQGSSPRKRGPIHHRPPQHNGSPLSRGRQPELIPTG